MKTLHSIVGFSFLSDEDKQIIVAWHHDAFVMGMDRRIKFINKIPYYNSYKEWYPLKEFYSDVFWRHSFLNSTCKHKSSEFKPEMIIIE